VVVAIAALNVAAFALIGHANAIAGLRGAAVQAVHLLAAGAWAGGLAALLLALRAAPSLALAQRFSRVGLVCVVTLAATGAYALYVNTGLPLPMLYYAYGRLADLKIKLFAGALALAGFNRFYAAPRGAWRLLVASVTFELALLALVIAVAANLGNTEPYG
jgi:putative copper resistance protein D